MNPKREANLEATIRDLREKLADAERKLAEKVQPKRKTRKKDKLSDVKFDSPDEDTPARDPEIRHG